MTTHSPFLVTLQRQMTRLSNPNGGTIAYSKLPYGFESYTSAHSLMSLLCHFPGVTDADGSNGGREGF